MISYVSLSCWSWNKAGLDQTIGHVDPRLLDWSVFEAKYFARRRGVGFILKDVVIGTLLSANVPALIVELVRKALGHLLSPGTSLYEEESSVLGCIDFDCEQVRLCHISDVNHAHFHATNRAA